MNTNPDIRRDLARSVIKEPLYSMTQDPAHSAGNLRILIEPSDDYHRGAPAAAASLIARANARPLGSRFLAAALPPAAILDLVESDYRNALAERTAESHPLARHLAIRRIWLNHPIRPQIDKSVGTIKADAARRAFLADGVGVVWAVIDSGIDAAHLHFRDRRNLELDPPLAHQDFSGADFTGANSPRTDLFGHGTHVAGIIAGSAAASISTAAPINAASITAHRTRLAANGQIESFTEPLSRIEGVAPAAKLISMKVLDDNGQGEVGAIIAALDRIHALNDYGRNIRIHGVNLSVGYEFDPAWFACGQSPVCAEVDRLVRSGVIVVAAAGNTGYGTLASNERPTGGGMMATINDPGNASLAITVGSTHRDAPHTYGVSYFSSKGPTGDGRRKPDLVAPGERILSCCSTATAPDHAPGVYIEESGTSMAAPHVSGAIAAFLSIRREYIGNPAGIKELFLSTATDLNRDPNFQGRGLIDLMRAIQAV